MRPKLIARLLTCTALLLHGSSRAEEPVLDLALILAIDCSYSVDVREYRLQMQGIGLALQSQEVIQAIKLGQHQRIGLLALQWSDSAKQKVVLPWRIISTADEAMRAGQALATMPRQLAQGGTSISNALTFSANQFDDIVPASRLVIDVSFDGRNNTGPPLPHTRDALVAQGIVINGLPIINEFPTLHIYAANQLIGGHGAFVEKANSYEDYGEAILRKLVREIIGPGVS